MPIDFVCKSCAVRFSIGWFHYHDFDSGYTSQALIACTACGAQHSIEYSLNRGETRHVDLVYVPPEKRVLALRLIRENMNCTPTEAKSLLDQLPVRLAERAHSDQLQRWMYHTSATGITLSFPLVPTDRLLGAKIPYFSVDRPTLEEILIVSPLRSNGEIDLAIQRCRACSAVRSLSGQAELFKNCPHCKLSTVEVVSEWIS